MRVREYCLTLYCPNCGAESEPERVVELNPTDEVVVNLSEFSQMEFHCPHCHARIYVNETDDCLTYEGDAVDDEEESI